MPARSSLGALLGLALFSGCSALTSLDDLTPGVDAGSDGGEASVGADAAEAGGDGVAPQEAGCAPITRLTFSSSPTGAKSASIRTNVILTAGATVVVIAGWQFASTHVTLGDSAMLSWTSRVAVSNTHCVTDASAFATLLEVWTATPTVDVVSDSITLSSTTTDDFMMLAVAEYASDHPLTVEAAPGSTASMVGASASLGTLSLMGCTNVLYAIFADELASAMISLGLGFTALGGDSTWSFALGEQVVDAATIAPSANLPDSDECWAAAGVALR